MSHVTTNQTPLPHICGMAVSSRDGRSKGKELIISEATSTRKQTDIENAVFNARSALWNNGQVLDFSFFGGTPNQHAKIEDTIQEWTWYANIIFSRSTPNNRDATLRIAFDESKGSWSYVGNTARDCDRDSPTMNLGWIGDNDTLTKKERGIILHEFGHVLGLMHEHESPERSGVMHLKEAEIIQYYGETLGWDEATVRRQVLDVYSNKSVSSYSQFDPTSIMMYFMPAAMNEGGVDIPEVTELSMFDKAFVITNYPRERPHQRSHQWTPPFALTAMGASVDAVNAYMEETDINEKRAIFQREMVELRMVEAKRLQLHYERKVPHAPSKRLAVVEPTAEITSDEEKIQRGIISLLFDIAPRDLLTSRAPAPDPTGVKHAPLDPNHITLDHPVVQHGLLSFFTKLASNATVEKAMMGAVKLVIGASGKVEHAVHGRTHAEKVQSGILSLLFSIAPKTLLFPEVASGWIASDVNNKPLDPDHLTLDHPIVQFGLVTFFMKLMDNEIVKKAMTGAVKLPAHGEPGEVEHHTRKKTHAEKVQDGILSLLFEVSPKTLLIQDGSASLDIKDITLNNPVVQHGLMSFFTKLASNTVMQKTMTGAVRFMPGTSVGVEPVVQEKTHAEKVQNGILSLLFGVAPKTLLSSDVPAPSKAVNGVEYTPLDPDSLTLDHPIVQHGLVAFFTSLVSNKAVGRAMTSAVKLPTKAHSESEGVGHATLKQTHTEKVQNEILSLLFEIAPKALLASNVPAPGSTGVERTPLDPKHLTLNHPIVQHGLLVFFTELASNEVVKETMTGAVKSVTKASGKVEHRAEEPTHTEKVQNAILSLLFDIAPKNLLASNTSARGKVTKGVEHGPIDPNNLTLDHPVVEHGLVSFFAKLTSNKVVKKAMMGAVKPATVAQNGTAKVEHDREETHEEKVQHRILALIFEIAPKDLLLPDKSASLDLKDLTLNHPVVQHGLMRFFKKLASNTTVQNTMTGAVAFVTGEVKHEVREQTHAEKVQSTILSLLLEIAPKDLFTPGWTTIGAKHPLDPTNLTLDHPDVQEGLVSFFTRLSSNKTVKKAMTGAVKLPTKPHKSVEVENTNKQTHREKVQNGILSLLFRIAPKFLLTPDEAVPDSNGVEHAPLDPNNLTLEHPVVQHGLMSFFTKLASHEIMKKAMTGAVKVVGESWNQHGNVEYTLHEPTPAEKVQNGILSLLLNIAPKYLLTPDAPAPGSAMNGVQHVSLDLKTLTLDHPVVQRGLVNFFTKLASDKLVRKTMTGAVKGAVESSSDPGKVDAVWGETHTEKVQNGILSLLFNIAPKVLLTPNAPKPGSNAIGFEYALLDTNHLTLDHPTVQHGLLTFFTKLASNVIVKKVMAGVVGSGAAVGSGSAVGSGTETFTAQQHGTTGASKGPLPLPDGQLSRLAGLVIADPSFMNSVGHVCGTAKRHEASRCEYTITVTRNMC